MKRAGCFIWFLVHLETDMQKERVRSMLLNVSLIFLISFIFFNTSFLDKSEVNYISYKFIIFGFICFWILPIVLLSINTKGQLVDKVSKIFSRGFRIQLLVNMIPIICGSKNVDQRIMINLFVLLLILLLLVILIYIGSRPRFGKATKKEKKKLENALAILELCNYALEKEKKVMLDMIINDLKKCIQGEIHIVHGIESNIMQECLAIQRGLFRNDENQMNLHISILVQLLHLSEQ